MIKHHRRRLREYVRDLHVAFAESGAGSAKYPEHVDDDDPVQHHLASLIEDLRQAASKANDDEVQWHDDLTQKAHVIRKLWQANLSKHSHFSTSKAIIKLQTIIFFLARYQTAFNVISRAARKFSNLENLTITMIPVSPEAGHGKSHIKPDHNHRPLDVFEALETLGERVSDASMYNILGKSKSIAGASTTFDALQGQRTCIHAEIQLMLHMCGNHGSRSISFDYIGCRKRSCFLCWHFLRSYGRFRTRGTHGKLYNSWTIREAKGIRNEELKKLQHCIFETEKALVSTLSCGEVSVPIPHAKESTLWQFIPSKCSLPLH